MPADPKPELFVIVEQRSQDYYSISGDEPFTNLNEAIRIARSMQRDGDEFPAVLSVLLEAAMDPWTHGDPGAVKSSVWPFLDFMSRLGGSDPEAVEEEAVHVMRDPTYTERCVIRALIGEVRRLRAVADG